MSNVQLKFTLRTSANVKTVHLLGSWDNYARQIPLSKDSAKPGAWVGKFRFQTSMLKLGGRYWYYVCPLPLSLYMYGILTMTVYHGRLPRLS